VFRRRMPLWALGAGDGLASISMRDLGKEVGLKAQSLYAYFDSKAALYDAMFRQGHERQAEMMAAWPDDFRSDDARAKVKDLCRQFVAFCTDDPVRYQLLFQRVIPDWEPSPASYALAVEHLDHLRRSLASAGIDDPRHVDLWTAVMTGLTAQQISNDPGGDRWARLVDDSVDMLFDHATATTPEPAGDHR
ncbi:MAG: TetR/AcrR family transcriptional regulator, partial [Acidimicrobiales bacterium]|nr:TetR/AcrR family transcriptional regulator [Acidimicrobiales bacterium]